MAFWLIALLSLNCGYPTRLATTGTSIEQRESQADFAEGTKYFHRKIMLHQISFPPLIRSTYNETGVFVVRSRQKCFVCSEMASNAHFCRFGQTSHALNLSISKLKFDPLLVQTKHSYFAFSGNQFKKDSKWRQIYRHITGPSNDPKSWFFQCNFIV